jgi:hypothetical protein
MKRSMMMVLAASMVMVVLAPAPSAQAHGSCSYNVLRPAIEGNLFPHLYGTANYNCTEGHAKLSIRVELQMRFGVDTIACCTTSNSKDQARNISATADHACAIGAPPINFYWRTHLIYARARAANGDLLHSVNDKYSGWWPFQGCS